MPRIFRDFHLGLLQRSPARGAGESGLRAGPPEARGDRARKAAVRVRSASRLGILAAFLALSLSLWIADGKDALLARLGYRSVAPLPEPSAGFSLDDQARYWTYALYDFDALKRRYHVSGYFAIDGARARGRLDDLLPHVSTGVMGEISGYTSIAFHAAPRARVRP